jgi:microcin C transport system substrate-binding protein
MLKTLAAVLLATIAQGSTAEGEAGMAMRSEPKYQPGFKSFDYVNAEAPKGGTLIIGTEGGVDTVNPYALKGDIAPEVASLVFQELGDNSLDEPFSRYPSVAQGFQLAADKLSMTVKLRPEAKFSDGKPLTSRDVVFSFETFQSNKVAPFYKSYWADIKAVTAVDAKTVKFAFKRENPELALITTEMAIFPSHVYASGDFASRAVGSGPYTVAEMRPGVSISFKRNPDWWAKDLAVYRGRFNFDTIVIKYYKDPAAMVEAFKRGDFDLYDVRMAKIWAKEMNGPKFDDLHYIKKELLTTRNAQGGQGFVFNLRLPLFQDLRVRQALALAFDFDWSNKNLFYGQYAASESFFQNTTLAASGMPSPEELAVLTPLKADLPDEVFTKPMGWLGKGQPIQDRLRAAMQLLKAAGYQIKDGVATGPGGQLAFKFLLEPGGLQRVVEPYLQNLRKLGVNVGIEEKEQSVFIRRVDQRDFEMTSLIFGQSQSPGNEQKAYWSSSAADEAYSQNYSGLKNKAVDALVSKVIYAESRGELELMTRCLDRALYHLHLMVHNWHSPNYRLAYWDKFGHPATLPSYYTTRQFYELMWFDGAKAQRLKDAQTKGAPLL